MCLVTPASVVASVSSLQPGEWVVQPEVFVESQQPRPLGAGNCSEDPTQTAWGHHLWAQEVPDEGI